MKADKVLFISATKKYRLKDIINVERFSTYRKLLRTTAVVLKLVRILRSTCRKGIKIDKDITSKDLEEAERSWIVEEQVENRTECERLEEQLGLYKDEYGVIRCQGRLSNSSLPYTTKYPVLLPRKGKLAELIVKDCHYRVNHGGQKETLEQLRSTMWLPKAGQFVRKVIFHCLVCKRLNGPCYGVPRQADLPDFRVQEQPAFSKVGADFGGPIYIKEGVGENKVIKKSYFRLFSCPASRAIHLEIVTDLRTETFLNCLRRFTSRRGIPEMLITDNASTYKRANKLLIMLFKRREVQAYLANQCITWRYNLELAPW